MAGFHTKTFWKFDDYMTPKYAWENIKQYIPQNKIKISDLYQLVVYLDGNTLIMLLDTYYMYLFCF